MKVPIHFESCVACWSSPPDSFEHVIPAVVGGQAEIRMLCTNCNSRFGHDLDVEFKHDPQIRMAVENVRELLPEFHAKYNEGLEYVAKGSHGGSVRLKMRKGELRVVETSQPDGSILLSTKSALHSINKEIARQATTVNASSYIQRYSESDYDTLVQISEDFSVAKRQATKTEPKLTSELVSEGLKLKIGYLHLALIAPTGLKDWVQEYPEYFQPIVSAANGEAELPEDVKIESGMSRKYRPQPGHMVRYLVEDGALAIAVRMFGVLEYKVRFLGLNPGELDLPLWIHDIEDEAVLFAPTFQSYQAGVVFRLGVSAERSEVPADLDY